MLCLYPYSPEKKSERLYGGLATINPIGLEVVATAAARHAEVMLVDLRLERQPLSDLIAAFEPDLILVSINWGRDAYVDSVIAGLPAEVTLMVGGMHPSRYPHEYFEAYPNLDLLAIGYGEKTVADLLVAGSPENINGLWFRHRPKAFPPHAPSEYSPPEEPERLVKNDFRHAADPASFHVDRSLRRYSYPFLGLKGDNIVTSIGCPMVCAFCGWRTNIYGELQQWLPRSAEDVVDEIAETDSEIIHIVDANFAHDLQRVEEICDLLIARDIRRLIFCEIRVNAIAHSAELVRKMEQAGFFAFMIGIEATKDEFLKKLKKGYTVDMCRRAFDHLSRTQILTFGNFLIGIPGQGKEDMLFVADYARELGLDLISPNKLYAYPGSDFADWIEEHPGYRIEGRRRYVVSDQCSLYELRQIQRKIQFRFLRASGIRRIYRKAMAHPATRKIGQKRIRKAIFRSLFHHFADPKFRQRTIKKALGHFKKN